MYNVIQSIYRALPSGKTCSVMLNACSDEWKLMEDSENKICVLVHVKDLISQVSVATLVLKVLFRK